MSVDAVFTHAPGDCFLPTAHATGPWGADRLHGGPVLGLLGRAVERARSRPTLVLARLTVDLFRAVPVAPLSVRVEIVQKSRRLEIMQASLFCGETEYVRASAHLLEPSDVGGSPALPAPAGPEGLETEGLMRGMRVSSAPPGFHSMVETRWLPRAAGQPLAIWFRLPLPLVQGEAPSPLASALALSDFTNAVGSIAEHARDARAIPYINTDTSLYLWRAPEGEWFCLQEQLMQAERGVSVSETTLFDARGAFGRAAQARLAYVR